MTISSKQVKTKTVAVPLSLRENVGMAWTLPQSHQGFRRDKPKPRRIGLRRPYPKPHTQACKSLLSVRRFESTLSGKALSRMASNVNCQIVV
jgi:hypothetical protein